MSEKNIFEEASRIGLRITSSRGVITVEDLWEIPLTDTSSFSLDTIAQKLSQDLDLATTKSFVHHKTNKARDKIKLALDIVKHIIEKRLEEQNQKELEIAKSFRNEKIKAIIAKKQDEKLAEADIDTLLKMLNE
jgi:hypothetical protein